MVEKLDYSQLSWYGVNVKLSQRVDIPLEKIAPNVEQPRRGVKADEELRKNIEVTGTLINPILLEPLRDGVDEYMIIDGERRWEAYKALSTVQKKPEFAKIPSQIVNRPLNVSERLRIWVSIHRQRKDWSAKEKEAVAYDLVKSVGIEEAQAILGVSMTEVRKLIDAMELAQRMPQDQEFSAQISYAREIRSLAKPYRNDDELVNRIIKRIDDGEITTSKRIRDLKQIFKHPKALEVFKKEDTSLKDAWAVLPEPKPEGVSGREGLTQSISNLLRYLETLPAVEVDNLKKDSSFLEQLDQCQSALKSIRKMVSRG
ncbi:MAG: ParB N-terminal domain-containing protein [Dehalococcoidales bacterium]|nr:ParB N-terminal domain-containing protein [Dehalococcoidales bacterium]